MQVDAARLLVQVGGPALPADGEVAPRLPPNRLDRPRLALQRQGGGVVADLVVELLQMVLGLLQALQHLQGRGPIFHLQGQHLQARLAARSALPLSCARPVTIWPMAARRSDCSVRSCECFSAVMSWPMTSTAGPPW